MSLATYSFLPWLRQGLANRITAADHDPTVKLRAAVRVDLEVTGRQLDGGTRTETVGRDVALYGPGDIVGIESRAIVRCEPQRWITDFEPNYLPHIEFYDEDLPWRYTPAGPDTATHRLRPWIALVVLAEEEFDDGADVAGKPLQYVEVADAGAFPPADQLWAWAHVHVDRSLAASDSEFVSTDMDSVLPRLSSLLATNPDLAHSRLVSPRKLAPNTPYHAFVMPVFEAGRLAGLGHAPDDAPHATASAWGSYEGRVEPQRYPYYHRWFFRTGTTGDFESLVRLLQPRPVDPRVGTRPMDVQTPGANLPGITDPELGGVLRLGGALRIPRASLDAEELEEAARYEDWDQPYPHPFQSALARLVNLADDYATAPASDANAGTGLGPAVEDDPDPLVTPPLYGRWHALASRLLVDRDGDPLAPDDNWVHELNLDPRHRVAAGFGTRVVQDNQEQYMHAAWLQIGDVLAANRRIRQAQLAREVSAVWHHRHVEPFAAVDAERALGLVAPVRRRVLTGDVTVQHRLQTSHLQPTMLSTALRRTVRPRGRLLRSLPFDGAVRPDNLLRRVGAGAVSAAPPKVTPPEVVTSDDVAEDLRPDDAPRWAVSLLRWLLRLRDRLRSLPLPVLVLLAVLLVVVGAPLAWLLVPALVLAILVWRHPRVARWRDGIRAADLAGTASRMPDAVDDLPTSSDFRITPIGSEFRPRPGGADSVEAARFKQALRESYTVLAASAAAGAVPPRTTVDPAAVAADVVGALAPEAVIPRRVLAGIFVPPRIRAERDEEFVEAMAYPEFDIPMYKPLVDTSTELFLPNLNLIEQNSITLLETNQPFIEAYMVGLNHELARELLWREYPTDQRGSYFRQFWDVSSYLDEEGLDAEALREKLRDIPPLHRWSRSSNLGDHDHREQEGEDEEEVVLVIRGELLKRYPNAVIYAHRACWQRTGADGDTHPCLAEGEIDNRRERRLEPLTAAEEDNPPRSKVRSPLYEAKVDPDITFFGFDLTAEDAMGGTGADPDDDPGWFFVIEERPGEPRFGLDVDQQPTLHTWNDLSWADVQPGPPGSHLQVTAGTPTLSLELPTDPEDAELVPQHEEDKHVAWSSNASAADLAYVLLQVPVRVAVHASEMLTRR